MTEDFLEYPKLMESAVRGVMREALRLTAEHGLPGLHHFYITFRTAAPGVDIPDSLRARYPDEMTIVVEHQYWDLEVTEDGFAVTLSFDNVPSRLRVPFDAISAFVDPSVKFGLQFQQDGLAAAQGEAEAEAEVGPEPGADDQSETVVALDQFRKK